MSDATLLSAYPLPDVWPVALLLERLRERSVRLSVVEGKLHYSAPRGALTPELLEELTASRTQVMGILVAEAEYDHLHDRIWGILDAARLCQAYDLQEQREQLLAQVHELVTGPYADLRRLLLFLTYPGSIRPLPSSPSAVRCEACGSSIWWRRPDGGLVCGVCHPDPESPSAVATAIPADGHGTLKLRVLEDID